MQKRKYGKTGVELSVVGFGGIICTNEEPEAAAQHVARAIDRGINYFDVAPSYGNAEVILGPALEPYRNQVFLACKTGQRKAVDAEKELHASLDHLRTDHLDLYQFHSVTTTEDVETIFGPGGAMETFEKAKRDGKVRFLGFSAHTEEAALAMMENYDFTSILFPINWVTWNTGKFGPRVVQMAEKKGLAILALKTSAKRKWAEGEARKWEKCWYSPVDTYEEAQYAVRFTLSRPVTAAVTPGYMKFLEWMCDAADSFTPLSEEEEKLVADRAAKASPIFPIAAGA